MIPSRGVENSKEGIWMNRRGDLIQKRGSKISEIASSRTLVSLNEFEVSSQRLIVWDL